MNAPNMSHIVVNTKRDYPQQWHEAHRDGFPRVRREAFIRLVASRLYAMDPRFGLNGKRGTAAISQDAIAFMTDDPLAQRAGGVRIIDVIGSAGSDEAFPSWMDVTQATVDAGTVGKWIKPDVDDDTTDPPLPPPAKDDLDIILGDLCDTIRRLAEYLTLRG